MSLECNKGVAVAFVFWSGYFFWNWLRPLVSGLAVFLMLI